MAKGGSRKHPASCTCGNCPKMGRPKKSRVTDASMAERILAKIKAEEEWVFLYGKARLSKTTTEATAILRYLEDRVYGKPVAPVSHQGDKENPVELNVGIANGTTERLLALLGAANKRRLEVSKS